MNWQQIVEAIFLFFYKLFGPMAIVLLAWGVLLSGGVLAVDYFAPGGGKFTDLLGYSFVAGAVVCIALAIGVTVQRARNL